MTNPLQAGVDHAELLPCPFCGGPARILQGTGSKGHRYLPMCCDPICVGSGHRPVGEEEAITAWNTRAAPVLPDRGWRADREAVARLVMASLWKAEQYNGVGPDYENYRKGATFDMGGRVEMYEKKAADMADAILALPDAPAEGAE